MLHKKVSLRRLVSLAVQTTLLIAGGSVGLNLLLKVAPAMALEQAKPADSLVDSVGVDIHLHYTDTPYDNFDGIVEPRLFELGVRHVGDGAYTYPGINADSFYYQRCRSLAAGGIKFSLGTAMKTAWSEPTDYSLLDDIYSWCNGGVEAFAGINEPDYQGVSNWVEATRSAQQQLFTTVTTNPMLSQVSVLGPSPIDASALGDLSASLHYGNMHPYPGGRNPETVGWGGTFNCGGQQTIYGSLAYNLTCVAEPVSQGKPVMATETGWDNSTSGIPENIVGRYVPRLFLYNFNQGVTRTYQYELLNPWNDPNNPEANLGLLRYDGSPKPAFTALKNLIGLLKDPGTSFTPKTLDYTLSGNTVNVQRTLLQKRNGEFYLALWVGAQSWDPVVRQPSTVPLQTVSLKAPSKFSRSTLYSFNDDGSVSTASLKPQNGTLNLSLTDRVMLVRLIPRRW
jgi:hypothetical protein